MKTAIAAIVLAILAACARGHTLTRQEVSIINNESPVGSPWTGGSRTIP